MLNKLVPTCSNDSSYPVDDKSYTGYIIDKRYARVTL
jgi:hypothetical protein